MIIKDLRILNAIARQEHFKIDRQYKYVLEDNNKIYFKYKKNDYRISYFSGCFYPYIELLH